MGRARPPAGVERAAAAGLHARGDLREPDMVLFLAAPPPDLALRAMRDVAGRNGTVPLSVPTRCNLGEELGE